MKIIVRADSSSFIGTGHIMRDLVLAKQFDGAEIIFATQNLPNNINHRIKEASYSLKNLNSNSFDEFNVYVNQISPDIVIIDSYDIDYNYEKSFKLHNPLIKLFVFDDTYRKHFCDILLNHNINADPKRYVGLVPDHCELRCGVKHTLLRNEFIIEKSKEKIKNTIPKVLVAMGGADHSNKNIKILKLLEKFNLEVVVLTTVANQKLAELKEYCSDKEWVDLLINTNEVARIMRQSDFAILTPSVTVNEAYFMNLPFIAIKTAENQKEIYSYLNKHNYMTLAFFNADELGENIKRMIEQL